MPYVQVSMALRGNSDLCHSCKIDLSIQKLILTFDLSGEDVNVIIGQSLRQRERETITKITIHFTDYLHITKSNYLMGTMPKPNTNLNWDDNYR